MQFPKKPRIKSKKAIKDYEKSHPFCEICSGQPYLGPHHIIFRSQGGSDVPENLIRLCYNKHRDAHGPDSRKIREELKDFKNG
jgi:5-methylcytosine-specific restriction endonuclease McrA